MYRDVGNNTPKVSLTIQPMRLLLVAALMLSYPTFLFIRIIMNKELKALESIREKINVEQDENGLYWLNLLGCASIGITQEEYDLLKEIIYGNDNKTTG